MVSCCEDVSGYLFRLVVQKAAFPDRAPCVDCHDASALLLPMTSEGFASDVFSRCSAKVACTSRSSLLNVRVSHAAFEPADRPSLAGQLHQAVMSRQESVFTASSPRTLRVGKRISSKAGSEVCRRGGVNVRHGRRKAAITVS